jgi:acetylornithine deacetylase/succinyl-diaminopimelate desuccinylase-like protein
VIRHVDRRLDDAVGRMVALHRFRLVATERAVALERRACAEWFAAELRDIGFTADARDAPGLPIAVGHDRGARGSSVLFCGHYATPPADPWDEHQRDDDISRDQSTQLMAFVEACRAWKAVARQLPTPVSVLIEGDQQPGLVRLTSLLRMYTAELRADIGLAPSTRTGRGAVPTISRMLRGLCREEFTIFADGDQPATQRPVADPEESLARILSDLHDPSGRVAIPGFYVGVDTADVGVAEGGCGLGDVETIAPGPTCEIDRVAGSSIDGEPRTASSHSASARLSFHLVCDQDPDAVRCAFRNFARVRLSPGSRIQFRSGASVRPVRFSTSGPAFRKAQDALSTEWGRPAVFVCGDAVPAVHALSEALSMEVIVIAFPERLDRHRSRREIALANFRAGIHAWARILGALACQAPR